MLLLLSIVAGCFLLIFIRLQVRHAIPSHIPWVGDSGETWSRLRLYITSVFASHRLLQQGYDEYSRNGRPFVFANLFTGAELLLPMKYMDWVHDQPENVLSSFEAHREFMRADWTFLHPQIFHEHVFEKAIKRQLTRQLDRLTSDLADEVMNAIENSVIPTSDGSMELNTHATWKSIVLQIVGRIYVGQPLCRDAAYLKAAGAFNDLSMLVAAIIGLMPPFVRPVLAPLVALRDRFNFWQTAAKTKPLIARRVAQILAQEPDIPDDLVTWSIEDAISAGEAGKFKLSLDFLAARISMMNFVSIDSTSITIENVLHDILSNLDDRPPLSVTTPTKHSASINLLDDLRTEARTAYHRHQGTDVWKRIMNDVPILDACLKESFRLNNFISRTNVRMVTAREGLEIPDVGRVAKGVKVGFALWGAHHDEDRYHDASHWRMSRWLECETRRQTSVYGQGGLVHEGQYLPFGFRKHACPGRFFAMRVVKLILLHLLLHFDMDLPDGTRGTNYWLGVSRGPPMGSRLRLRRRHPPLPDVFHT